MGGGTPWWLDWFLKAWKWEIIKSCSFLWIPSSCGLQILAQDEPLWSSPLPSLCCVLSLLDTFCRAEDTSFGKLCNHRKPAGNSKWIFRDTGQCGRCGRHSPFLYMFFSVTQQCDYIGGRWGMRSQETTVVPNLKGFWRWTLPTGLWQKGMESLDV